jgi:outer membrane protein OmpA-like peptidoglycan-associated protein
MKTTYYKQNKTMIRKLIFSSLMLIGIATTLQAQDAERTQPKFWLGVSGGANVNMYTGTTQTLNPTLIAPAAFHDGLGVGGFASLLLEFRPVPVIGFMLNLGYDNRGGAFDQVISPCDCPEDLKTGLSYATVQPSIRISPFGPNFYVFLGGAYGYNLNKSFAYTFDQNNGDVLNTTEGEFSDIRPHVFSTHVGMGYDIQLSAVNSPLQVALSPFVSYHPYFGQAPRTIESWSLSTVRVGMALKFGTGKVNEVEKVIPIPEKKPVIAEAVKPVPVVIVPVGESDVKFITRAPLTVPVKRTLNESFPIRNYVFFEETSTNIPNRYVKLNKSQAVAFKSEQLRKTEPKDQEGRSKRQLNVYYNILNILGDRMRENPKATVTLIGASAGNGAELGKSYAESVKTYLVDVFGIAPARITTEGRDQPVNPSELPGGKSYLAMLRAGDRRVDIISTPDLLTPLEIISEQPDPLDSRVVFSAKSDKNQPLKTWNVALTDENGTTQVYGPYTREQESVSGNTILGNRPEGKYKVLMTGQTQDGVTIRKESTLRLVRNVEPKEEALRFSILFDFDQPKAVQAYEKFLVEVVTPQITDNSKVIIHGHTDIVGSTEYNMQLSERRALDTRQILEKAVYDASKKGVVFETIAFGMDADNAPFENKLPEERFYNRTVIIDIVKP